MSLTDGERAQALQMGEVIAELREMRRAVEALESDIADLKDKYKWGKGALFGLSIAAGFMIFGLKETVKRLLGM